MDDQNKNLLLATVLSFAVIAVWFVLFPPPPAPAPDATQVAQTADGQAAPSAAAPSAAAPTTSGGVQAADTQAGGADAQALTRAPRVRVDTPALSGSISTLGGRIDDLSLKSYRETLDPTSAMVRLFSPVGQGQPYYAVFAWAPAGTTPVAALPGPKTQWAVQGNDRLTPDSPVTLVWQNGTGLQFQRTIAVDDRYMFTVTDRVTNSGTAAVDMFPYSAIWRQGHPATLSNSYVLHEGVVGRADGVLTEIRFKKGFFFGDHLFSDLPQDAAEGAQAERFDIAKDGWIGFTEKYWMATLIPAQGSATQSVVKYDAKAETYETRTQAAALSLAPGATVETSTRLFAGAKEWETIRGYQNEPNLFSRLLGAKPTAATPVPGFIDSIDWGWFYFFTKPIFFVLHELHGLIGNMGLAIIALTFVLKLLVLPLAYKSYVSMARMKELQPEMEALKERAGEDKALLQREMMKLYKEKKVNPAAGCLPMLIQVPIFFSLYKVIFVTLELRHAPFVGWLQDLSAPDPSSLFNLFGLLPWAAPVHPSLLATIFIGLLPMLLGGSMWLQQKLNPAPADPAQQAIFAWMPWIFMFMLGSFASGLVLYWITNNLITFTQQFLIMRSHGHSPDIFGNIRASFGKKAAVDGVPVGKPANKTTPPKGRK